MSHAFKPLRLKRVKREKVLYAAAMLLCCLSASVIAQEWVDVKDPKETRALLSNKTLHGLGGDSFSISGLRIPLSIKASASA